MSDQLTQLETWAEPLLQKLDAGERRSLARSIATELRKSQRARIKDQFNPDGSHYAPRKHREKQGRIKRHAMFMKLRQNRYLKTQASPNAAAVGFFGQVANLVRVHQRGLRDRVRPGGPEVKYEKRELLGFTDRDKEIIMQQLSQHFEG